MGGVCLTLYGFIAVSGLKMFKDIDLGDNKNLFTVSTILIAGIGGLSIKIPYALASDGNVSKTITITSIATALILGIVVHAIIQAIEKKQGDDEQNDEPESLIAGAVAPKANFEVGVNEIAIEEQREREEAVVEEFRKEEAEEASEDGQNVTTEE